MRGCGKINYENFGQFDKIILDTIRSCAALLTRGMKPNGTLWSANAVLNPNYHKLLLDTHLDFVKARAEVIVTTTFTTRRKRLRDNNLEDKFEYLNEKAGEIALNVKKKLSRCNDCWWITSSKFNV